MFSLTTFLPRFEEKGERPVTRSKKNMPNDHQSAGLPCPGSFNTTWKGQNIAMSKYSCGYCKTNSLWYMCIPQICKKDSKPPPYNYLVSLIIRDLSSWLMQSQLRKSAFGIWMLTLAFKWFLGTEKRERERGNLFLNAKEWKGSAKTFLSSCESKCQHEEGRKEETSVIQRRIRLR